MNLDCINLRHGLARDILNLELIVVNGLGSLNCVPLFHLPSSPLLGPTNLWLSLQSCLRAFAVRQHRWDLVVVGFIIKIKVSILFSLLHVNGSLLDLFPKTFQRGWHVIACTQTSTKVIVKLSPKIKVSSSKVLVHLLKCFWIILGTTAPSKDTSPAWPPSVGLSTTDRGFGLVLHLSLGNLRVLCSVLLSKESIIVLLSIAGNFCSSLCCPVLLLLFFLRFCG